jgi:hypothetical protein
MLRQGILRMAGDKRGVTIHYFGRRFADYDQAHDDCILRTLVGKKVVPAHALDESTGVRGGLPHMIEIVSEAGSPHTGAASART